MYGAPEESKFIQCARNINSLKPKWVVNKMLETLKELKKRNFNKKSLPKVGFLGATFKPDIDDLRESPSLQIIQDFSATYSGEIYLAEPNVQSISIDDVIECSTEKIIDECDLVIILVNHKQFNNIKFKQHNQVLDFVGATND